MKKYTKRIVCKASAVIKYQNVSLLLIIAPQKNILTNLDPPKKYKYEAVNPSGSLPVLKCTS